VTQNEYDFQPSSATESLTSRAPPIPSPLPSGITVKTAVSLPDEVFQAAERLARERGLTRSSLYAQALEAFLEANEIDPLTEAINRVADRVDTRLEPGLKRLQEATLERHK
jgi:hypothetical protein